jgi:hypothetical protein
MTNSDAQANAEQIEGMIEALQSCLHAPSANYQEFWNQVKEINKLFRTLKPILAADRQRLWEQLGHLCEEAKEQQAESRRNWESRKSISANKRSLVESKIREAYYQAKGGSTPSELGKAGQLLREALEWMKNGWSGFNIPTQLTAFDDGKMTKADHDACWERWQEANEMLHDRRRDLGDYHFDHYRSEAEDAIGIAEYDPKRAKEKVKAIQQSMHGKIMTGEQFTEIRRLLDKAWEHASGKQNERHEEWEEHQQGKIEKKRDLIRHAEETIDRIEEQIDHCRDLEADARSDDYAEMVRGWIEEKYDVIAGKRRFIADLEEQIREIESRLH